MSFLMCLGYTKMVKNLTGSAKMAVVSKSAWFLNQMKVREQCFSSLDFFFDRLKQSMAKIAPLNTCL